MNVAEMGLTFGCKFSISQIGKQGSKMAIADVDTKIAMPI